MQHNGKRIIVDFMSLPLGIGGAAQERESSYIVIINSDIPPEKQQFAIGHELAHIFLNHHSSGRPIAEIEKEADERAMEFYSLYSGELKESG